MHGAQGVKPLCVEVSSVGLTRDKEVKKEKQLHSVKIFFSIRNGGSYIYLEPQMIAIFEGQPPQNKAELPIKTRVWSFGFQVYSIYIYIHGGGWLNHRLAHQGWITSSLGWCKPRDRICTAPKVFGDPFFWGGFFFAAFGIFEKNHLVGFISYNDMCIYIYIYIT